MIDGEEIGLLRETARRFVARECNQWKALEWDRARAYPREVFDRIAAFRGVKALRVRTSKPDVYADAEGVGVEIASFQGLWPNG